jgi:hypothetical protein
VCRAGLSSRIARTAALLAALLLFLQTASAPNAGHASCKRLPITLSGGSKDEIEIACSAGEKAADTLEQCGIAVGGPLHVQFVDHPVSHCGVPAYGTFDASSARVEIASFAVCRALVPGDSAFARLDPTAADHSIIVHEMTHAMVSSLTRAPKLTRAAHEYLASVVQIQSMEPEDRKRFLGETRREVVNDIRHFNEIFYYLRPDEFAALAFEHFGQPENGCAFIQRVLRREVEFPDLSGIR